jgi:CheY-like chemotaxis protein
VEDHGIGITDEALLKVFDPYFTTKRQGSGLGLATSYSIVKKHGGYIGVTSRIGEGTTFYFYLPASPHSAPDRNRARENQENKTERPDPVPQREPDAERRLLVMDDDPDIQEVVGEILEHLGFKASFAANGNEAISMYADALRSVQPFEAVIMDLTVPGGMGGKEAVKRLRELEPNVKAIVSSGYSNDPVIADHKSYGFDGCVVKPFSVEELGKALCSITGSTTGPQPEPCKHRTD